jgi:hypothetical protein
MNTKFILKTTGVLIVMVSLIVLTSCSRKANGYLSKDQGDQQDTNLSTTTVDEKNLSETDEDLTTVDYKEFYDQLAPHGEWIQVKGEEIGLQPKTASTKNSDSHGFSLSNLLGIKDAYASTDADMGMFFVWKPSPDLSVTLSAGEQQGYRPYRNGQWENTDDGWYFRAPTPWEETVHHHGRWVNTEDGWLWVPGRVWAPAWVNWRQNDDYVSWAPLPPSYYLVDGNIGDPQIDDDYYVTVERRHFIDPDIYRYDDRYYPRYDDNGVRIEVGVMIGTVGLVVVNNVIINRGPDINIIQNIYGRHIDVINIRHVRNYDDVRYSDKQYSVYTPEFKRYKNHENTRFIRNEPKSFKNYSDIRKDNSSKDNGNQKKSNDNGYKQKGNDNGNKQKSNDNGYKQKGNDNGNKQKSNNNGYKQKGNDNGNKQKSNDNGYKQKGNDNGNQKKSNDNGYKQKSNDNGNKQKGNDNGNKQKGNDNGKGKK